MFICLFFIIIILIISPKSYSSGLLRKDYYESLSYPIKCFVLSHNHPTGPPLLFTILKYNLHSYIFGSISKNVTINIVLKKIEGSCNNSIILATMGRDFKKLEVEIFISLFYDHPVVINISYIIYKGIVKGSYQFWDYNQHYSFNVKILNDVKEYLITSNSTSNDTETYLSSLSKNMKEICLITINNNAVVLKPIFIFGKPDGLISGLYAEILDNNEYIYSIYYPAFQCDKSHIYPNETVFLIIDEPHLHINFYVYDSKIKDGLAENPILEFVLVNIKFDYVDNLKNVKHEIKIFFYSYIEGTVSCLDGTKRTVHICFNQMICWASQRKYMNVSSSLEKIQDIYYSVDEDICQ